MLIEVITIVGKFSKYVPASLDGNAVFSSNH